MSGSLFPLDEIGLRWLFFRFGWPFGRLAGLPLLPKPCLAKMLPSPWFGWFSGFLASYSQSVGSVGCYRVRRFFQSSPAPLCAVGSFWELRERSDMISPM